MDDDVSVHHSMSWQTSTHARSIFHSSVMVSALKVKASEAVTGTAIGHKTHRCPAVHPCQHSVSEGEQFRIDDREHGLATAMTVAKRKLQ